MTETVSTPTAALGRERRSELLAAADPAMVVELADRCLAEAGDPQITAPPEVGMVMMTVREPVEATRFHLGEVLVTRAEVRHRGALGWSMRMGEDRAAALAAAILDAEVESAGPCAAEVEALCRHTGVELARTRAAEWASLAPTTVTFEELDQ